jgi:glycine C-acetyltransferase
MSLQEYLQEKIEDLKKQGLKNDIAEISSPQGAWFVVNGRKMLNLCSNNYLGLANDFRMKAAAIEAVQNWGVGPGAVRTISGTQSIHLELEKALAKFKGAEDVILLQSGFNANLTTIPLMVDQNDVIFSDELNHASIIDGCRLSKTKVIRYSHCDAKDLEKKVVDFRDKAGKKARGLIITDGVFSMDGDMAPLDLLVDIAEQYDLALMVDDAHGEGVLGEHGRGVVNHFQLEGRVDIEVGTLSKAFGVLGGYVAGSSKLCNWLRQRGRPFLFSTGISAADCGAALEAVKILDSSSDLVDKLWDNAHFFQVLLRECGFDLGGTQTPITPIIVKDEDKAQEFSRRLMGEGIFIQAIVYPTVQKGRARLRAMISASHTKEDLKHAASVIREVGINLGVVGR